MIQLGVHWVTGGWCVCNLCTFRYAEADSGGHGKGGSGVGWAWRGDPVERCLVALSAKTVGTAARVTCSGLQPPAAPTW